MRPEPLCSGTWKCLAILGDSATRSMRSSVYSKGSIELNRSRASRSSFTMSPHELCQTAAPGQVFSIADQVHSGESDFAKTAIEQEVVIASAPLRTADCENRREPKE